MPLRFKVSFNKVRLSSNWLEVYYRRNLTAVLCTAFSPERNRNYTFTLPWGTSQKDKAGWGSPLSWRCPRYFGLLSIPPQAQSPEICLPNAYAHPPCQIETLTEVWTKTSFSHIYMGPILLSPKYCPIYACKPWQTHSNYFHLTQGDLNQHEIRPILVVFLKYLATLSNPPRILKDWRQNKTRQPGSLGPALSWTKETSFFIIILIHHTFFLYQSWCNKLETSVVCSSVNWRFQLTAVLSSTEND